MGGTATVPMLSLEGGLTHYLTEIRKFPILRPGHISRRHHNRVWLDDRKRPRIGFSDIFKAINRPLWLAPARLHPE
jgi:hypothetical protein